MANDLLNAITTGIADADPTAENSRGNETEDTSEGVADEVVDTTGDGGTEEITAEAQAEEAAGEKDAEAAAAAQTPEEKAAADAAKADADAKAAADPNAKKPDAVNDPIPNALKPQTKERIQNLIKTVKQKDEQIVQVSSQLDEIMGHISATKATPKQYGDTLEYLSLVNSGQPANLEKALNMMLAEVNVLARALGKPVPGVDMLADHKDLQGEIDTGMISRDRALEIAAAREQSKMQTQRSANIQQQTQAEAQTQQAITEGRNQLNALETTLQADPAYKAKKAILVESLKPVFNQIHPSQWAATFKAAYDNLKIAAPKPVVTRLPVNQPMRAKTPAGGGAQAPGSLLDAISNSISGAR